MGDALSSDRLIWPASKSGEYSIKSGYWWVRCSNPGRRTDYLSSSRTIDYVVWKGIWRFQAPPKVKHFVWHCVRGAIATWEDLFRRRCTVNPCCPICHDQTESVKHLILLCPWMQPVWFSSPLCIQTPQLLHLMIGSLTYLRCDWVPKSLSRGFFLWWPFPVSLSGNPDVM